MKIKQLGVLTLKNNKMVENSAVLVDNSVAIVEAINGDTATVWTGTEYLEVKSNIPAHRLVIQHELVQVSNSITLRKDVTTDVDFAHFKSVLTLAVNGIPLDGVISKLFNVLRRGDSVKVDLSTLGKMFPDVTVKELKDAIGLVTNIEKNKYHVMILNKTIVCERRQLTSLRNKNTKYVFKLTNEALEHANELISQGIKVETDDVVEPEVESKAELMVKPMVEPEVVEEVEQVVEEEKKLKTKKSQTK